MTQHPVLIVEQDPGMQNLYKAIFRPHIEEFRCHTVASGEAALRFADENPIEVMILGLDLPVISGLDVLELMRQKVSTKSLPIIVVTPLEHPEERLDALRRGADHYQGKSFNAEEFLARIRRLVSRNFGGRGPLKVWSLLMASLTSLRLIGLI